MAAAVILGLIFGSGVLIILTAQERGKPRPSLQHRLDALDPRREDQPAAPKERVFRTDAFEDGLRPVLERIGNALGSFAKLLGISLEETALRLRLNGDNGGLALFLGQKVAAGLIGIAVFPAAASISPLIPSSAWLSAVGGIAGFLLPDMMLRSKATARQQALRSGIARFADLLTLGVSAGLGLEAAVDEAVRSSDGPFFDELRRALKEARLRNDPPSKAIARVGSDLNLVEAQTVAASISSAESHGIPVTQVLRSQASSIRQRRRLELIEAGERAQFRIVIPIGLLIMPAFFLIILYPAAVSLLQISAR